MTLLLLSRYLLLLGLVIVIASYIWAEMKDL